MKKLCEKREVTLDSKMMEELRNSNITIGQFKKRYGMTLK